VETFRCLAANGLSTLNPTNDVGLTIAIGRCLSIVVYGQLVAENCRLASAAPAIVSVIFRGLVEDLTTESLRLSAMLGAGGTQETLLRGVVQVPRTSVPDVAATFDLLMARYGTQS
jgi:hypothetical protein